LFLHDAERGLVGNDGERLRSGRLLEGEAFKCFFHLEPTLFDVLRFFQLAVFRHACFTRLRLRQSQKNHVRRRKKGPSVLDDPLL